MHPVGADMSCTSVWWWAWVVVVVVREGIIAQGRFLRRGHTPPPLASGHHPPAAAAREAGVGSVQRERGTGGKGVDKGGIHVRLRGGGLGQQKPLEGHLGVFPQSTVQLQIAEPRYYLASEFFSTPHPPVHHSLLAVRQSAGGPGVQKEPHTSSFVFTTSGRPRGSFLRVCAAFSAAAAYGLSSGSPRAAGAPIQAREQGVSTITARPSAVAASW